jgi:polyhydroxybutyrate depolymerase
MARVVRLLTLAVLAAVLSCGPAARSNGGTASPTPRPAIECRDPNLATYTTPAPAGTSRYETMTVGGALRDFRVFVPASLDLKAQVPLVIQLHGSPATVADFQPVTHFDDEATQARFLAAYPDGCDGYWNAGRCCTSKANDVAFIEAVIDRMEAEFPVDRSRVFLVGASAGSMMGYRVACELADRIDGFASDAGTIVIDICQPTRPVPIFEMHGTLDADIPYDGGRASIGVNGPSVASLVQLWVQLDGCVGDPTLSQNGITKTSIWKSCRAGATVRLDTVVGGHHQWFGSDYDPVPGEPNFNREMWGFLSSVKTTS